MVLETIFLLYHLVQVCNCILQPDEEEVLDKNVFQKPQFEICLYLHFLTVNMKSLKTVRNTFLYFLSQVFMKTFDHTFASVK